MTPFRAGRRAEGQSDRDGAGPSRVTYSAPNGCYLVHSSERPRGGPDCAYFMELILLPKDTTGQPAQNTCPRLCPQEPTGARLVPSLPRDHPDPEHAQKPPSRPWSLSTHGPPFKIICSIPYLLSGETESHRKWPQRLALNQVSTLLWPRTVDPVGPRGRVLPIWEARTGQWLCLT